MWSLELLATFDRPGGLKNHQWRFYGLREEGMVGLLSDPTTLRVYLSVGDALVPGPTYRLPAAERWEVALQPHGPALAVAAPDGVHEVVGQHDQLLLRREELGGEPRGVLYDRSGAMLWVSLELPSGRSQALAVEARTRRVVGSVEVGGIKDSYHTLRLHPSWEAVSLEVSCGQDGTWLSFLEWRDGNLRAMPGLERPGRPSSMAGFDSSGRWFAVLSPEQIELCSWPEASAMAQIAPPSAHQLFDWPSGYVGDRFLATTFMPDTEEYRVLVLNHDLKVEATLGWDKQDQGYLFDLVGLPGARALVFGDQRAGLFKLKPRPNITAGR
jgi:hypothetical protein